MGLLNVFNQVKVTTGFIINMNSTNSVQKLAVPKNQKGLAKISNQINIAMGFIVNKNSTDEEMKNIVENSEDRYEESKNQPIADEDPSGLNIDIDLKGRDFKKIIIPIVVIGVAVLVIRKSKKSINPILDEVTVDID